MALTVTEKVLSSTDGNPTYVKAVGDHTKPSIVFIHGVGLSAAVFDGLFKNSHLLDKFYLVAYDMRGHGRSGKPTDASNYSSSLYAADFATVSNYLGLKRPILVGWSLGATVACDVCAHLGQDAISAIVYMSALPYIGPIMNEVGTSTVLGFLPGLFSTDDMALSRETKIKFIDSLFADPDRTPLEIKWSWLGCSILQSPEVCQFVLSREQDPTKLFEAGAGGLPLLIINGTSDSQVKGDVVVREIEPKFTNTKVVMVKGGSHAVFFDNQTEVVDALLEFGASILVR